MGEFSLGSFAAHLAGAVAAMDHAEHHALERAARLVEREAKRSLGHYQDAIGPFAAWEPLHESTLEGGRSPKTGHFFRGKIELGYASAGDDNPLEREGGLRDSIHSEVGHREAVVGSNSVYAAVQELGDPENNQPPRSFLGGAAARKAEEVARIIGEHTVATILGRATLEHEE